MGKRKNTVSHATATEWDGAPDPGGVSTTLREARERLGVELRDVASILRIRYVYLQAIENGRYDDLPGAAYAAGFLRSYAEYLGLDPAEVLRRYKDEAAGRIRKQELYYLPMPAAGGGVPGGTVLLGTLVLAGIVYGSWYYLSATDRSVADMVPALPDRLVSLLDNLPWNSNTLPAATVGEQPAPVVTVPQPTVTASVPPPAPPPAPVTASAPPPAPPPVPATTSAPSSATPPAPVSIAAAVPAAPAAQGGASVTQAASVPPPTPSAVTVAAPTPAAPVPPRAPVVEATPAPAPAPQPLAAVVPPSPHGDDDEADMATQEPTPLTPAPLAAAVPQPPAASAEAGSGKVYGAQNTNSRFQVRAKQDSWIQVRDAQDIIFTRVLKPGDTYHVPDRPGIRLRTGNAGGLVIVADGVEGPPMGSVGQVLRDVPLDGAAKPAR
ncbi:MAG TPA: helix-turn-helix domain-containing protein [Azospirillum sp.]|nr:helix-turn-helix domain-containing protein [Azospirillum sp.]